MTKNFTLSAILASMVFANAAAAIDPASYTLSSDGKTLTKWLGTETEIDFATDETLMKVEAIGTYAFQDCSAITIINLNPGLTAIERGAFMDCTSLATITLPATLTTIGNAAFSDCRALRSIDFPSSVTTIGTSAFYGCESITNVTLHNTGVTQIADGTFNKCTSLSSVDLGVQITAIGEEAFLGCEAIESLVIPESVSMVGVSAFSECYALKM